MNEYLEQKFIEIYRDISQKSKEECLPLIYTYLGRASEGSMKGFKLGLLNCLETRMEKGNGIVENAYNDPKVSVEAKTAMDIIKSTFVEYSYTPEALIDEWRGRHSKEATKGLYELSMVYQGREFNGEKSPHLESIEDRYRRANKIILKHARKDITQEKLRAIKDLAKTFTDYEKRIISIAKYRGVLRNKNQELLSTLDKFAEHYKIIPSRIRKKQKKPQEPRQNILLMPAGESVKKMWDATKKALFKKIF